MKRSARTSTVVKTRPAATGSITLPAEVGEEKMVVELAAKWGADAIRDSDGTELSPEMLDMGLEVYSTTCLVRAEQTYPRQHMDQLPQKFLMSDPVTATGATVVIDPMSGFYREKYVIDTKHSAKRYWEVIDRTTGEVVSPSQVELQPQDRQGHHPGRDAVPRLHGELPRVPDLGHDLDVQPPDEQLEQAPRHQRGSLSQAVLGPPDGVLRQVARGPSRRPTSSA